MALIRSANSNLKLSPEEEERLRQQVFSNLIDEKLQIQAAKQAEITIDENLINQQYAQLAARFKQSPEDFSKYLTSKGSSAAAVKQQIRGEFAWDRLLSRSEEHTSDLQSLMRISYAVFCLKKKTINEKHKHMPTISTKKSSKLID